MKLAYVKKLSPSLYGSIKHLIPTVTFYLYKSEILPNCSMAAIFRLVLFILHCRVPNSQQRLHSIGFDWLFSNLHVINYRRNIESFSLLYPMANLQMSYISSFYQFRLSHLRPGMPCTQHKLISLQSAL